jgi:hypothetical protein
VFEQNTIARTASSLQFPPNPSSINSTSHLFKKQQLWFNPTFMEPEVLNNVYPHDLQEEAIDDDDNASVLDANSFPMDLQDDGNSVSSHRSVATVNFSSEIFFVGTTKVPAVESEYSCFTISQKCITSLMYLLDETECPDYAFQCIMDWAHNGFEAGFDFNPKSKTRLGNLKWMYDSLHNSKQIMPHVISIQIPDPLPDAKSMDVI